MSTVIVVKAAFDPDARVWFVEGSDVPGLKLEAPRLEELRDKLPAAILDLLREDEAQGGGEPIDAPIELIAHASTRLRQPVARRGVMAAKSAML